MPVNFKELLEKFDDIVTDVSHLWKYDDVVVGDSTQSNNGDNLLPNSKFYDINTGEFIDEINDGIDRIIAIDKSTYLKLVDEFEENKLFNPNLNKIKGFEENQKVDFILSKGGINLNLKYQEFNEIAGTVYGECDAIYYEWKEAAAIYSVMRNRTDDLNYDSPDKSYTIYDVLSYKYAPIYGYSVRWKAWGKDAKKEKLNVVIQGIFKAISTGIDYSNGATSWHGRDFSGKDPNYKVAYNSYYLVGFKFTKPEHDFYNLGNYEVSKKPYKYMYESTAFFGRTTFMKTTDEYRKSQYPNYPKTYYHANVW